MTYKANYHYFNTEKDRLLVSRKSLVFYPADVCTYFQADLFVTKKSNCFYLFGSGRCLSIFRGAKEKFIPVDRETAFEICKEYLSKEEFEKVSDCFG